MKTVRVNDYSVLLSGDFPVTIYVNENIHIENSALEEIDSFRTLPGIEFLSYSPDVHKGSGTSIGTTALIDRVYPAVTGNDIGCGMRFDVTSLDKLEITPELISKIRHTFFEGGRDVHVKDKRDVLSYGIEAELFGQSVECIPKKNSSHSGGSLGAGDVASILESYHLNTGTRDNFLGSIGGGNHFVEIQQVEAIVDKVAAWKYGLKVGSYCIMSHSGSLDLGHAVGNYYKDLSKKLHTGKYPKHGYFSLDDKNGLEYIKASYNAANFATVNRAVMASMLATVLDTELSSVYDSPHNLIWLENEKFLHRKGSCPADVNELVMIPGSMGTPSCIALGQGFNGTYKSSAHGAGRVLNRGAGRLAKLDSDIIVVTKIDPTNVRADIAKELAKNLAEESPSVYKDIREVISTSESAGIIKPIAWMKPILTIKG